MYFSRWGQWLWVCGEICIELLQTMETYCTFLHLSSHKWEKDMAVTIITILRENKGFRWSKSKPDFLTNTCCLFHPNTRNKKGWWKISCPVWAYFSQFLCGPDKQYRKGNFWPSYGNRHTSNWLQKVERDRYMEYANILWVINALN